MRYSAAIALLLQTGIAAPALLAQNPPPPPPKGSIARDSVFHGPPDNYGILGAVAVLFVPPPSLLFIDAPPNPAETELAFWRDHLSASVSGGPAFDQFDHTVWAHSADIELL